MEEEIKYVCSCERLGSNSKCSPFHKFFLLTGTYNNPQEKDLNAIHIIHIRSHKQEVTLDKLSQGDICCL